MQGFGFRGRDRVGMDEAVVLLGRALLHVVACSVQSARLGLGLQGYLIGVTGVPNRGCRGTQLSARLGLGWGGYGRRAPRGQRRARG